MNPFPIYMSFAVITLVILAVAFLIRDLFFRNAANVRQRLGAGDEAGLPRLPMPSDTPSGSGVVGRIDRSFSRLIAEAGFEMTPEAAFLLMITIGLLLGGGLVLWREDMIAGLIGFTLGTFLTYIFYVVARRRRRNAIQEQLPDVMELLARAVRAGESIDQAITMVGDTAEKPLGPEFRRCARQLEMGLSLNAAMRALSRRAPLTEMRILSATLMVQRQAGGNLPITLERLVGVIRDRISYHRQFKASTAAGRTSTLIIASVGPLVAGYMFIWQREYYNSFLALIQGRYLLAGAIVLQIVGLAWIYMLLRNDY